MKKYLFLIIAVVLLCLDVQAQTVFCNHCKGEIKGEYIRVEELNFHPEHFLCSACGRAIESNYAREGYSFYHPDCKSKKEGLVCGICGKVLSGRYTVVDGKKYHEDCYRQNVAARCSVCQEPIEGEYATDAYGNSYHSSHINEYPKCDNCGRLICTRLTGGGMRYSDGRNMCSLCFDRAISDYTSVYQMFRRVLTGVKGLGIDIGESNITIKPVDLRELRSNAGDSYSPSMKGFCRTSTQQKLLNGKVQSTTMKHTIFVLNGVPPLSIEETLAHELMHVWINENTEGKQSSRLAEGSCNYISYLYLSGKPSPEQKILIRQMELDPDADYGGGFLAVRNKFESRPVYELLKYLKKNNN